MRAVKKAFATVISAALICTAAACGVGDPNATGSTGGGDTITYALSQNPNGIFNPSLYGTDYDRAIIFNVYSRLVHVDKNQEFQPELAESWTQSEDGKTVTFKLRQDVKWHDGEPFTADDVVYNYTANADPDYPSGGQKFVSYLKGYKDFHEGKTKDFPGVKALDKYTVEFDFETPYPAMFSQLVDYPIFAKHIWEKVPIKQWKTDVDVLRKPVGTGPYKFKEFADGQYVSLEANPDYFGGAPKIKNLIFKVINSENLQAALTNGEVNIADVSDWNPSQIQAYKDAGAEIVQLPGSGGSYMGLDTTNPRLKDVKVRQALVYAADRQSIIDSVLYGHAKATNAIANPEDPNYPKDLNEYKYDPEKAKELLKEAGWTDTDGDGILDKDGEKFTFKIEYSTNSKLNSLVAPILQKNYQAIGIDASLASVDFNSLLSKLLDENQQFDGAFMGSTYRLLQYGANDFWSHWTGQGPAVTGTDLKSFGESASNYLRAQNEAATNVWLYVADKGFVVKGVDGFDPYPYETFLTSNQWTLKK
ncbi:ABC transporter substrate-binding protein [Bifidobacterium avesanii]|nr:ABC transporter substrate-binding protein [Bifidobacterium avesanii]KAB8295505.1 ABC transporter substrate-binding protein [Bifidobacterium avesanii]